MYLPTTGLFSSLEAVKASDRERANNTHNSPDADPLPHTSGPNNWIVYTRRPKPRG